MKKLLSTLAIAAASTALAVESSNTFGILRVDSSAAQTIVSIPWEAAGGGSIKVKDVVKTANLTPASGEYIGDQLYYYDTTAQTPAYKMWRLTSDGWEGSTTVANGITSTQGTDEDKLVRGGAIILVRKNPTMGTPAVANPFYLYGQYTNSEGTTTCVLNGLTLLASPLTTDTDLNKCTWANVGVNDEIYVPTSTIMITLKWLDDNGTHKWGVKSPKGNNFEKAVIPAGQGVWYKSNATEGSAPTVTWVQKESAQD